MSINFKAPEQVILKPIITVFGVGGAGGNAVKNMINANLQGANFVVANTDAQALEHSACHNKIQLGATTTRGLGAGASPEVGRLAAEESLDEIKSHLENSNMVFITAGMGGGTGTGASPVIAKTAKEMGILTVGVVTKPFHFEGGQRMKTAEQGLKELQKVVDTLIIITNQNLFSIANENTTFQDAFALADKVLAAGVRSVTDLIIMPGLINLDFADISAVMREMGKAMMGTGEASGEDRAIKAAECAISNPLLEHGSIRGAKGVLINITGGADMTLFEVDSAATRVSKEVGNPDANIIFGSAFNPELNGVIRVSVVATGIDAEQRLQELAASQAIAETNAITENALAFEEQLQSIVSEEADQVTVPDDVPDFDSYNIPENLQQTGNAQAFDQQLTPGAQQDQRSRSNAPQKSLFAKMWDSLKSGDKAQTAPPQHQSARMHSDNRAAQDELQDVPAFLRRK